MINLGVFFNIDKSTSKLINQQNTYKSKFSLSMEKYKQICAQNEEN
jgi:hypothetical protein